MLLCWPMALSPTNGRPIITSNFGDHLSRVNPSSTPGVDIMYENKAGVDPQAGLTNPNGRFIVQPGDPCIAPAAGIVERVQDTKRGVVIQLDHGTLGAGQARVQTIYRHLRLPAVREREGVVPGLRMADVSFDPEDRSQTPHLHFEILLNGKRIDPAPLLSILPVVDIGNLPPDTAGERVLRILRETLRSEGENNLWLLALLLLLMSSKS